MSISECDLNHNHLAADSAGLGNKRMMALSHTLITITCILDLFSISGSGIVQPVQALVLPKKQGLGLGSAGRSVGGDDGGDAQGPDGYVFQWVMLRNSVADVNVALQCAEGSLCRTACLS